ncbi:MAG: hypothetical protein DRH12_15255 [Deltaproteobacteria bacterium]|nr:MAG: hypothetical protein DRH12_15255 [Deltaproteobacteria bacterium]
MDLGPTIIKKCSACSGLIEEYTILSGNTFYAKYWTDGKCEAPMLPDQPWLVKCPHCQSLIWIDEQEKVAEINELSLDTNADYDQAEPYDMPGLEDYFGILEKNKLTREKELYVRIRAWWAGNDERREVKSIPKDISDVERSNLQVLVNMLDTSDDNDCIMIAEIKRELGDFEGAIAVLEKTFPGELSQAASIIRELARNQYSFVEEINPEN